MKISVIVPVFNGEKTLKQSINSMLAQGLGDFELILIDDGSTDKSGEICRSFAQNDNRVRYIKKENGGPSSVRNLGIKEAKGEYITFADCDDYMDNGAFAFMYEKALETKADMVVCGCFIELGGSKRVNNCEEMIIEGEYGEKIIPLKSKDLLDAPWNKLYKTEFLRKTGVTMPEGEIFEDTAFHLELLRHQPKIAVYSECFYHYVQNMGSITKKYNPDKLTLLKKRAKQLKDVTVGIEPYCDFYYIKSVFSAFIDMFLSCKKAEIKQFISKEIGEQDFINAAKGARFQGRYNSVIISVAKSGNCNRIYNFCKLCYILKYKARKLFIKVR
ncbi:MAG: glycosyltransferase family 2 protein [Clostridia bacterium]|nr:glycosyltransferase family 2 protein [Clostridia bacterium]